MSADQLENPPVKAEYEQIRTWWGPYKWPPHEYARFEFCAGLEKKADQFRCMSSALSNLQGLQELGVCLDSGLGWLAGPDVSDRARIFQQKCKILGSREAELEKQGKECREAWNAVLWPFISVDGNISDYFINRSAFNTEQTITTRDRSGPVKVLVHGCRNQSLLRSPRPLVFGHRNLGRVPVAHPHLDFDFRILDQGSWEPPFVQTSVQPYNLTAAQREWLLETEWAQRAFLSSYCMALTDNSHAFKDVRTLNIAKLSSNHLSALQRKDVWEALPNLDKVILIVAADFRSIHKNADGSVEATDIQPSDAVKPFHSLLQNYIASTKSIKTLEIGYIGGGEHQTGIFGRNRFVLPAPIADYESLFGTDCEGALNLPHVENLSMVNCWVAPPTLRKFVSIMSRNKLRSLTLESVSLTAHAGGASFVESLYKDVSVGSGYPRSERSDILNSLYAQRPPGSDPILGRGTNLWVHQAIRVGSWPHVIDAISPGPTLDLVRYAFRYCEEAPRMRIGGTLEVIDFKSCGYVRLVHQPRLNQSYLPQVNGGLPDCLRSRASELMPVMMHRKEDSFWGQIATDFIEVERTALTTGFPMTLGWDDDDDDSKFDNLEDGQPIGGSGRFSGRVQRL